MVSVHPKVSKYDIPAHFAVNNSQVVFRVSRFIFLFGIKHFTSHYKFITVVIFPTKLQHHVWHWQNKLASIQHWLLHSRLCLYLSNDSHPTVQYLFHHTTARNIKLLSPNSTPNDGIHWRIHSHNYTKTHFRANTTPWAQDWFTTTVGCIKLAHEALVANTVWSVCSVLAS